MSDLTVPSEGSATTPSEIADELVRACEALRTVDYNAVASCGELDELLEARDTLRELCHNYRRRQSWESRTDRVDLSDEYGNAPGDGDGEADAERE